MKIALTAEQYEKLASELQSYLQHRHWGIDAALHVAVIQNHIFDFQEQWVLPEVVRAWVSQESGVRDLDEPLTTHHVTRFLANFVIWEQGKMFAYSPKEEHRKVRSGLLTKLPTSEDLPHLTYTKEFGEAVTESQRRTAEQAISQHLFSRYLECSIVEHARYAYTCAFEHFPLSEIPSQSASTEVLIALVEYFCGWQTKLKRIARPTKREVLTASKELLTVALAFLHPEWVQGASPFSKERDVPQRVSDTSASNTQLPGPAKTVGVQSIHARVLKTFEVIDQHDDPDALFPVRVVLPDAEYEEQVLPLAGGFLRLFDFRTLGITLIVMREDGQGGCAYALKREACPEESNQYF